MGVFGCACKCEVENRKTGAQIVHDSEESAVSTVSCKCVPMRGQAVMSHAAGDCEGMIRASQAPILLAPWQTCFLDPFGP